MTQSRPFFHRVESARGIGAMIVAAWHVSGWAIDNVQLLPHQPWRDIGALQNAIGRIELALLPGHAALMMFFVISGFVLRISLQYGPQEVAPATLRFLVARIFRIYPITMFAAIAAAIAFGWTLPPTAENPAATPLTVLTFVANLLLVDVSLNSVLWAIQLEVVMAPFIVLFYFLERRHGVRALVIVAVVTSLLSFYEPWTPWRPLSYNFFAFVLGMLIPTVGKRFVSDLSRSTARLLFLSAIVCLFVIGPLIGFFSRYSTFVEGYAAVLLISLIAYRLDLRSARLLDVRLVRLIGLSSGSYYVLHMLLLLALAPLASRAISSALMHHMPALAGPIVIVGCVAALVPGALLGYYLIEARGIALGRRVTNRITRQQVSVDV